MDGALKDETRSKMMEVHRRLRHEYMSPGDPACISLKPEIERAEIETNLLRILQRLDLSLDVEPSLPDDWTKQQVDVAKTLLIVQARNCCHVHSPACRRCALMEFCEFGQEIHSSKEAHPLLTDLTNDDWVFFPL